MVKYNNSFAHKSALGKFGGIAAGLTLGGMTAAAFSGLLEHSAFVLREHTLAILPPHTPSFRILHISDIHMHPVQVRKQHFIRSLINLAPDLVINTGDNLAHHSAVKYLVQAFDSLLSVPGVFVFGSNDYYAPVFQNPLKYLRPKKAAHEEINRPELPWRDMRAAFIERGWHDATNKRLDLSIAGLRIALAGVDDPHIDRDRFDQIAGPADQSAALRIGLTHSPEPRVLDRFAEDGYNLVLAGHTHGGQLCLPGFGALVTNCGLDRKQAKGRSSWGDSGMQLHVSAGLGTSPHYPLRMFCRPEVTLLKLVSVTDRDDKLIPTESEPMQVNILPVN